MSTGLPSPDLPRVLPGVPAGGEFAGRPHPESGTALRALTVAESIHDRFAGTTATADGTLVTLDLADDQTRIVTAGQVDAGAVHAYQAGQCHALAIALSLRTGFPLAYSGYEECTGEYEGCTSNDGGPVDPDGWCSCVCLHLGVVTPDGFWLDINGPAALPDVDEDGIVVAPGSDDDAQINVVDDSCWRFVTTGADWADPDVETALSFAGPILDRYELLAGGAPRDPLNLASLSTIHEPTTS